MQRKKILWLVSWYPNKNDPFDGDFIQRHAWAAAIYHDIHVIHVIEGDVKEYSEEEWQYATGLTEQIIYFKKKSGLLKKLRKQGTWNYLFQKSIDEYIKKEGLPDLVHVHVPWKAGLIGLAVKHRFGIQFLVSEHWGIYNSEAKDSYASKSRVTNNILKQIYTGAKEVITVSKFLAGNIEKSIGRKVDHIIPNVVDTTLFFHQEKKYSRFSFIHVSNMVPLKNAELIIESFYDYVKTNPEKNAQLIMVGNRDDTFTNLAEQYGLLNTDVFFRGEIPYTAVADEMRHCHCFVLASDSETFSCVTAEALCSGLPVISTSVGALPELVSQVNGRLVPAGNKSALVTAMKEVADNYDSFDHKQIARDASQLYSYSALANHFKELYE